MAPAALSALAESLVDYSRKQQWQQSALDVAADFLRATATFLIGILVPLCRERRKTVDAEGGARLRDKESVLQVRVPIGKLPHGAKACAGQQHPFRLFNICCLEDSILQSKLEAISGGTDTASSDQALSFNGVMLTTGSAD